MTISLHEDNLPARATKVGSETFSLAAGKSLKIETSPQGSEILDEEVPAGKTWEVSVNVYIVET